MKRGLKELILKLLLFLLPIAFFYGWIEIKAREIPNSYRLKKQMIESRMDSIRILVLGSSNTYKAIDPALFSCKGFNLANSSQTLFYDDKLCLKYISRLPQLKAVIMNFSFISFFFEISDTPDNWRDYFYFHYYGIRHPGMNLVDPKTFSYAALYSRIILSDFIFHRLDTTKQTGDIQSSGWEKAPVAEDPLTISDSAGSARLKFHMTLIDRKNVARNIGYLNELISELKKRNIKVFLVTSPVCETYYKFVDPSMDRENHVIINGLCKKYDLRYFDYFRDDRFGKEDFFDNDHLNRNGAEKFSSILDKDIVSGVCR
jgi:hypothetical protein